MTTISTQVPQCRETEESYIAYASPQPAKRERHNTELQQAIAQQPPLCECARFAKRALSWATWIPGFSQNSWLDRKNAEFSHEHIIFDATRDNFGFGPSGYFEENLQDYDYTAEERCYDGSKMRQMLAALDPAKAYGFFGNNCQRFAESAKNLYETLFRR